MKSLFNEFLNGKGDGICRKIVKEEYYTFVRLEMKNSLRKHAYSNILKILQPKKGKFSDKKF